MTKYFLKAKHWQLFILLIVIPIIFQMVMMSMMISNALSLQNPNPDFMNNYFNYFIVIMILYLFGLMGWFWSMAIGLQSKLPYHVKMRVNLFKFFFFVPVTYISLILIGMKYLSYNAQDFFEAVNPNILGVIFVVIIPLHLFSMFCMFYMIFFAAKTVKSVELQKEAEIGDYIVDMLLLWFYPVGVWIIQPRINKLTEREKLIEIE